MASFEQLESHYQIQFPEDFLALRSRIEKSGVFTLTDEYTLLEPDDIMRRKPCVLWPELIPVIQNCNDGCAICLRAPLVDGEGYFWDWFDGETAFLGSLGRDFSAVLRTIMIDLYRVSFHENDPVRASTLLEESRRMAGIAGVVPDDSRPLVKEFMDEGKASSTETLGHASGAHKLVPVMALAEVDSYRRSSRSETALLLCDNLLATDPRFLNVHWCLGALNSMRGRLDMAFIHFSQVAEGEWGRIWPSYNLGRGFWHADLAVVAEFISRNADRHAKSLRSSIILDIFTSGAAAEGSAWERALGKCVESGDWMTARTIALNGMIDSHWPPGGWPSGYVRRCLDALVLACEKLGFAGRADGLLELWLTSPDVE